ncbi:hypothetical protein PF005_g15185 [Phytophthora fragariae]|uniref:Uncharacterized protein n=1 Tax=Phytophthora fragariae TaxID=53985 RepID=A0A6A3TUU6_9STRA|nr:hypothetical protein PF009_g13911 [Phytophthora fragariae]KAE9142995.1 hypothetical protein PF006_g11936 [Phytophthora fragariae]KAE9200839.1 hypothetical protein PF005_g15185 [Phytophthora fragariae]
MVEAVPLAPPEDGVRANWVFLIRFGFVTGLMVGSMVFQMGKNVPALVVKTRHVITIAILTALAAVATLFAVASATTFPVPFSMDPSIQKEMEQQTTVLNCQISLTLIYPMYIYGFTSFTGVYQTIFVVVLPIIKLIAKKWVSRALTGHNDLKPEAVIFNVEVFNALYISNALQVASTQASTITIMAVDFLHFGISMYDILEILREVKVLMATFPDGHPHANDNFVQLAMHLLDIETRHMSRTLSHFADASKPDWRAQVEEWVNSKTAVVEPIMELDSDDVFSAPVPAQSRRTPRGTRVFPLDTKKVKGWLQGKRNLTSTMTKRKDDTGTSTSAPLRLEVIFSREERDRFIREAARVLFITEYVLLVEYVEVVLPLVYCAHHAIVHNLHNRAYYPMLAGLSSSDFFETISHVVIYSSLEFASLIISIVVLKRTLGFSSMRQLSFVLENQAGIIQGKLLILLIYVMQISLVHVGADFSFKFAWLHATHPSG